MANICDVSMVIKGTKENRKAFIDAMEQKGKIWIGRGIADAYIDDKWDDDAATKIDGWCKWSVQSACIDNAISMRDEPKRWSGLPEGTEFITLWEACERWNLKMEAYSSECGICFQEHMMYDNRIVIDECVDYYEHYIRDFETKEEAEEELGIKITDEQWENEDYISEGGYEWNFEI